ncbi:unnamed protein product [Rotaria sordida]|uniref:Uncharacterized protein n=1 Tax=Rotaria sordida TaxID=392033 RepID=A0A813YY21_9BILA|nr:unnamed protein product [Rotaria sordida]CAF0858360.1 unnamed protein product [Rotaria sordida]CAF0890634.1 unnamed protein product [Rotaria sordida]CAF0897038.1 unnamed protein product [Rotaria sordida]CAF0904612.1 unnamed protein product [Rotaria sordida]
MALQSTINLQNVNNNNNNGDDEDNHHHHHHHHHHHEYDEEIDETEDDLIENYRFLTQRCGVLRQSPTTNIINTIQQQQQKQMNQSSFFRHHSVINENHNNSNNEDKRSSSSTKQWYSPLNDLNNNNQNYSTTISRIPPTIYYDDTEDSEFNGNHSFSLIKLFARMKARLKHDKRYRPKPTHELLPEEDPQEWHELTQNVRTIVTKALLPDGGYDVLTNRTKKIHSRRGSCRKSREFHPVLPKDNNNDDDDDKINIEIDDEFNTEDNKEYDQIIWNKFLTCSRGFNYRRCGVCKTVDRQQFQGQLVYFYGVANNILIDENLKASGLG